MRFGSKVENLTATLLVTVALLVTAFHFLNTDTRSKHGRTRAYSWDNRKKMRSATCFLFSSHFRSSQRSHLIRLFLEV